MQEYKSLAVSLCNTVQCTSYPEVIIITKTCLCVKSKVIRMFGLQLFASVYRFFEVSIYSNSKINDMQKVYNYSILHEPFRGKKDLCVGRESNPGQLLGRQLCLPLYHRRLDRHGGQQFCENTSLPNKRLVPEEIKVLCFLIITIWYIKVAVYDVFYVLQT